MMNRTIKADTPGSDPQLNLTSTAADVLSYAIADSDLGKVLIARSKMGVCSILLGDDAEELTADLASRFPQSTLVPGEAMLKDDIATVLRYISKPSSGLHLPLDMRGTPFQCQVWEKLQAIDPGKTHSYTQLAMSINPLTSPRAVARACAANPIALAIPCQRIIRTNGDLAGYRWGLDRKRELIRREKLS